MLRIAIEIVQYVLLKLQNLAHNFLFFFIYYFLNEDSLNNTY